MNSSPDPFSNGIPDSITQPQWVEYVKSVWPITYSMSWIFPRIRGNHPAPATPELYYRLILLFSKVGDTVLDIYMGLGTLIALISNPN